MASLIAALGAVVAATIAASIAYWSSQRQARRQAQLSRVNSQLSDFYGPMLAHASVNTRAFRLFLDKYRVGQSLFARGTGAMSTKRVAAWESWIRLVFMPANRAMVDLITSQTHLIDDDTMPECLVHFLAHASGYEVVLGQWSNGDYSQLTSLIDHPG